MNARVAPDEASHSKKTVTRGNQSLGKDEHLFLIKPKRNQSLFSGGQAKLGSFLEVTPACQLKKGPAVNTSDTELGFGLARVGGQR